MKSKLGDLWEILLAACYRTHPWIDLAEIDLVVSREQATTSRYNLRVAVWTLDVSSGNDHWEDGGGHLHIIPFHSLYLLSPLCGPVRISGSEFLGAAVTEGRLEAGGFQESD